MLFLVSISLVPRSENHEQKSSSLVGGQTDPNESSRPGNTRTPFSYFVVNKLAQATINALYSHPHHHFNLMSGAAKTSWKTCRSHHTSVSPVFPHSAAPLLHHNLQIKRETVIDKRSECFATRPRYRASLTFSTNNSTAPSEPSLVLWQ